MALPAVAVSAAPRAILPAVEVSDALPVEAVAPAPEASVISPVVAVNDSDPAVNVPLDVVMPLLFVRFNVVLTVKLASLRVSTPVLVLLTKALPLLIVAALAKLSDCRLQC